MAVTASSIHRFHLNGVREGENLIERIWTGASQSELCLALQSMTARRPFEPESATVDRDRLVSFNEVKAILLACERGIMLITCCNSYWNAAQRARRSIFRDFSK